MLDRLELRLLADAQATAQQLAARLPQSPGQIGRRRRRPEAEWYVTGYRAALAADAPLPIPEPA